jgi:glycosyl transferase family 2
MRLAATLLVRDEADIVEAHLAFHLSAGVDIIVATDHRSKDGTTEILESYAREGRVHLIRRDDERIRQSEWVTHMARLAAVEHGADWVINSDADEFWWPREGSLKDVLAAVPPRYGVVYAVSRVFVPRPGQEWFAERMTARLALTAPINDPATPFRHVAKVAHRGDPRVVVLQGNHRVSGIRHAELRGWSPLEVLHFPFRSLRQLAQKYGTTSTAWERNLRGDLARAAQALEQGRAEAVYGRVVVDDETLRRGLAGGSLVEDVRLRDALRVLHDGSGRFAHSAIGRGLLRVGQPSFAEDASRAIDAVVLAEANGVRLQRRADELAARLVTRGPTTAGFTRSPRREQAGPAPSSRPSRRRR